MTIPYTFGTQSGSIPLDELDQNFQYLENLVPPLATSAVTVTASAQPNISSVGTLSSLSCTGTITSGTMTANLINGTLQTSSQPNITSLGTLTSLSATGNVTGGNVIATNFVGSGTQLTGISGPIFMAYNSSNQNLSTGATVLIFGSTSVNTDNYYNTTNGLFTPLIPGYYQVNVSFTPELVSGTADAAFFTGLYKTGSLIAVGLTTAVTPTWGTIGCSSISTLVYLNGSTDYLGIASLNTINSGTWRTGISVANYFQATWVHA